MNLDDLTKQFYEERKRREGHKLTKFFRFSEELQLVALLATGFFKNMFYMTPQALLDLSKELHIAVAKKDADFYLTSLEVFRRLAFIKDQILLGLAVLQLPDIVNKEFEEREVELLTTFPPKLVLRWVNLLRTRYIGKGFAHRQRRLVTQYLNALDEHKLEYYAMRYPSDLRVLVMLAHPRLEGIHHDIIGFTVAHKDSQKPATDRLEMYQKFPELSIEKQIDVALSYDFPFELIRSRINKKSLKELDTDVIYQLFNKIMSPSSVVFNVRYLLDVLPEEKVLSILDHKVRRTNSRVSSFEILRAGLNIPNDAIANKLLMIAEEKAEETIKSALLPRIKVEKVDILLDVSGSMFGENIRYTLPLAALLKSVVNRVFLFSNDIKEIKPFSLSEYGEVYDIAERMSGGTYMGKALKTVLPKVQNHLLLFTDEQENGVEHAMDMVRQYEKHITVINPTPYPAHAFDIRTPLVNYVPATTSESLVASIRIGQLYTLDTDVKQFVLQLAKQKVQE